MLLYISSLAARPGGFVKPVKRQFILDVAARREIEERLGYTLDSEHATAKPEVVFMTFYDYAMSLPAGADNARLDLANTRRAADEEGVEFELLEWATGLRAALRIITFRSRYTMIATFTLTAAPPHLV